jgi:hypothetical protein
MRSGEAAERPVVDFSGRFAKPATHDGTSDC